MNFGITQKDQKRIRVKKHASKCMLFHYRHDFLCKTTPLSESKSHSTHTTQTIPIIQSLLIFYIRKRNLVNHQSDFTRFLMELIIGFEPMTSSLPITPFTCCGLSYRTQTVAITGIPFLLPSYLSIAWGDFSQDFTPNSPHSRRLALLLCSIAE